MASKATPGELRTRILVLTPTDHMDAEKYSNTTYENIHPDNRSIRCKWVTAYGMESVQAQSIGLTDVATLTLRYNPKITNDCIIKRVDNGKCYEIVGPANDVKDAHKWLEIRISRREAAV